jgi:hypothetical protein
MARKGNDNDRYVVPNKGGGWDVVKEDHQRVDRALCRRAPEARESPETPRPAVTAQTRPSPFAA